jgi:hypothetical protein
MAKPAHIADFERLEEEIDEALIQKSTDDPMIVDLKRRKSHLRNEIELLRRARRTSRLSVDNAGSRSLRDRVWRQRNVRPN